MKLTNHFVKFTSCGLPTWKASVNKWFFIPSGGVVFELVIMAACRLGHMEKGYFTTHVVHEDKIVRVFAWNPERGLVKNTNK